MGASVPHRNGRSVIVDVAQNPRIAQLLGRIEETRRLAEEHPDGHPTRRELEQKVGALYAEVGRYVHWLVRQEPAALERLAEEGRRWARTLDESIGYTPIPDVSDEAVGYDEGHDEESFASSASFAAVELTGDSRIDALDVRALGGVVAARAPEEPVELGPEAVEPVEAEAAAVALSPVTEEHEISHDEATSTGSRERGGEAVVVRTGSFEVPARERVQQPARRLERAADGGDWLVRLRELLEVLGEPRTVPPEGPDREALLRSLAQATTNLEVRWSVFPDAVQQALLGLVAARARRLEVVLPSDPDIRLTLGRMRRFAEDRGLLVVPALRDARSASRNWGADEQRYWAVLHAGM